MHKMKRFLSVVLTVCMLVSILSTGALAVSISEKPDNGTTVGQPFAPGTGGSQNFRIPGIVTLDDGTLIAACDARWNHAGDGAGLDSIVSVSKDNGENWTYTFANYLGDNGDVYNNLSTCIIDPGIGTDGETAYLIADLWPAGIALNTSKHRPIAGENGFDDNGNLLLRALSEDTVTIDQNGYNTMAGVVGRYKFYLDLETLTLHNADGSAIEGYTVDAFFNIKGEGVDTNLFFADSPYQPYPTDYLYMTTSTDGLNWSEPTLLNLQEDAEQTLLVGPGNGTYDKVNDRIIFTAYEHSDGYERASLIWMDSEGNWTRSEDCTVGTWSSEASSVVLDDGTVRVFYRDGYSVLRYTDMIWNESEQNYFRDPQATEVSTSAAKQLRCQLTTIKYSKPIDGKDAIIVATPASSGGRNDGFVYVFLVNDDNSMELKYAYDITPGENEYYAYSCLTELNNGDLGLLWESGGSAITYSVIEMDKVTIRDNDPSLTIKEVELLEGYTATFTDNSGYYVNADISELNTEVATLTMTGSETTTNAAKVLSTGATIDLDSCQYTFTKGDDGYFEVSATTADGTKVFLNHYSTTGNSIPNVTSPAGKIAVLGSSHENMFKLQAQIIEGAGSGAARGLHFYMEYAEPYWNRCGNDSSAKCHEYLYRKAAAGETASAEIPGYVRITNLEDVVNGQYLIAAKNDAGNWYVLNPASSNTALEHVAQIMGASTIGSTELTFTGVAEGYTEVVIGSTLYKITVHNVDQVNVDLTIGESKTVTETTGNYADADTSALNKEIATVTMTGVDGTAENGLSLEPVSELTDGTYVIINTRANKILTNARTESNNGLLLNGAKKDAIAEASIWTITEVNGGYTLQDQGGKYMTISQNDANVTADSKVLTLNCTDGVWTIGEGGQYLNQHGGGSSTRAAGYGSIDDGSKFYIYAYTATPYGPSTKLTFAGVAAGTTSVLVGHTYYTITVTEAGGEEPEQPTVSEKITGITGEGSSVDTSEPAHDKSVSNAFDGDLSTFWATVETSLDEHYLIADLGGEYTIDKVEYTKRHAAGQANDGYDCTGNLLDYVIEVSTDKETWTKVANGDTVNGTTEITFEPVKAAYVRLTATKSYHWDHADTDGTDDLTNTVMTVAELAVYGIKAPHEHAYGKWNETKAPTCTEMGEETRTCACGATETREVKVLDHNYANGTCTNCGAADPSVSTKIEGIKGTASAYDQGEGAVVENAFDGDVGTYWATPAGGNVAEQYLIADLGEVYDINQVDYTQRYDATQQYNCTGNLLDYVIEVSVDGENWTKVANGDTVNGTTEITFEPVKAAYVRLTATKSYHWQNGTNGQPDKQNTVMTVAELAVYGIKAPHEHAYGEWNETKAPTCTEKGEETRTCACGATETREVKVLDHTYDDKYDATCNQCGNVRVAAKHAELSTNIGDLSFVTGETQEFTFTTTANDDAGISVVGVFNFSDSTAIAKLEYLESQNGQWYELNGAFGPETGFPMINGTSTFRVTFAKAGDFTVTVDMKVVATGETLCSITKEVAVAAPHIPAELTTNIGDLEFIVGVPQEFTYSTVANDDAGIKVIGTSNFSDPDAIAKLEYYEPSNDTWYDLAGAFGGANGFPMADATSKFRVTFAKAGEFSFTSVMKTVDGDVELCSVEATASVREYKHAELTTNIDDLEFIVGVPQEFTYSTVANDDAGIKVIGTSNFSDPDAIAKLEYYEPSNDTWYDLTGAFGGANGFSVADATSKFRVTFAKAGEFSFTSVMKTVDGDVELCSVEATASVREYKHAELTTNIDDLEFIVGVPQEFTYSTVANDDAGVKVIGVSNFSDPDAIEKLEYYEPNTDAWYELNGEFGPADGFPMADATSKFRVTFAKAGEYTFTAVMKVAATDEELCSVEATAVVNEAGDPFDPNDPWGKKNWVKVDVDSETIFDWKEGNFEYAWDGNLDTIWHSNWKGPHDVLTGANTISGTIDFTREYFINQFSFTPRKDDTSWANGSCVVLQASLYVKDADDTEWKCVAKNVEFEHNQEKKTFYFEEQDVRYVKFVAEKASQMGLTDSNGNPMGYVAVAEFDIDYVSPETCDHSKTEIRNAKAATCTEGGYTGDTYCVICSTKIAEGEATEATGHAFGQWTETKAPTCEEKGIETRTCACGETETRDVDALGHDYDNGKCGNCGDLLTSQFVDVEAGKFYFNAIAWAVENDITKGITATTFEPMTNCTRGQVVTFLWRAAGSPEPKSTEHPFTDVEEGKFYYKAMLWAVENGITTGMTSTTFAPNAECTRGQVVTFLWRAKNKPAATKTEHSFTDVEQGKFYYEAMLWAVENDITKGITATTFEPMTNCTRGQVVTFLYRTYNK